VRLAFRDELARAREVFGRLLAAAEQRGEARSGVVFIVQLCEVELRAGDAAAAARALEEFDRWAALEPEAAGLRARVQAALAAVRGDPGRAAALAAEAVALSEPAAREWDRLEALRAAGLAALLARQPEQAITSLTAVWEHTEREGIEDPGAFPVGGDLAEALAEAGQLEAAGEVTGRLAAAQQHPWGLATADRSAAVVALAGGYDEAAAARLDRAAAAYRAAPGGALTPGERRVAELAAAGLSNKQVAAQLYLSVYTVEAHLSRVYAKLGVRSRTQLARRLGAPA
jgi:DNA-binding CsgD family transcriptional regulator